MAQSNYKDTVLTPRTDFPMRAGLVANEPVRQARWAEQDLYGQIRRARQGRPQWILHDGPPYANGDIHIGHALNKVLKDMVVKFRTMQGYDSPYVPGWDCHGLPIEHKVMIAGRDPIARQSPLELRALCREHARQHMEIQSREFQRLGIFGQFERPYFTMDPQYEGEVLNVFAELVEQDLVYRQLKPVHWCIDCGTALAEAELEYQDRRDTSVYVNFPVTAATRARLGPLPPEVAVAFLIWTTTPWTLPANMAIAVHPEFSYQLVRYTAGGRDQISIIAEALVDAVMAQGGIQQFERLHTVRGADLAGHTYRHAFIDRTCPILPAAYVTLKNEQGQPTGSGLVHTAPGHGADDYFLGGEHGITIYSPVNDDGTFDDSTPDWIRGRSVWEGNELICRHLESAGHLFCRQAIEHSYPHCWRSKTPTIFRCTEQWFLAVDRPLPATKKSLREMATAAVNTVTWLPEWGHSRIKGMLDSRPDWCLSRQRAWGLPIPAFYDPHGQVVLTGDIVRAVARHFANHGSDAWFVDSPEQILGSCPLPDGLAAADLTKEHDIFDVWFESGSSWAAVCRTAGWSLPVDLYLEGSDQHRGWFQLSLLPALGTLHRAPFKTVLTHGFVVDENGRKMSKSAGNVVDPQKEVAKYGADVIRLWVASVDYQNDIRCSDSLISSLQDEYRKVRNTIRFLLGATYGFDPARHAVAADGHSIDAWARLRLHQLIRDVTRLLEGYAFYRVFKRIHDFCNLDLSQIYFVALKDRLYCDLEDSRRRRRSQTVLHEIADTLIRLLAPILVHTSEEAWEHLTARSEQVASVHLARFPEFDPAALNPRIEEDWDFILKLRDDAMRQLNQLKQEQGMTNPLDGRAVYRVDQARHDMLLQYDEEPADVLGVGSHHIELTPGEPSIVIEDVRERYGRCARSWKRRPDVGSDLEFPDLSRRDAGVMKQRNAAP